jgi:AraC-like DNA-binding protein
MNEHALVAAYERELSHVLYRLREGPPRIVVPTPWALHRRSPGSHFHAFPELFLQTGGATDFVCPGGTFRLKHGEFCVMPAGVAHAETPVDLRTPYGVMIFMQNIDKVTLLRGRADEERASQSPEVVQVPLATRAYQCLVTACESPDIQKSLRGEFVAGCIQAFLASIVSALRKPAKEAPVKGSPLVAEAEKLVRVQISQPELSVALIASRLACSPDHLTRLFRNARGVGLAAWITRERVELACEILARPDHNISEVAWSCGFTTPSYFIKVFRKQKGMTPVAWRRLHNPADVRGRTARR